jgi:tetratricopeptide (TPR) repeat protein
MDETAVEPAFAAISKARALMDAASAPEKALIDALAKRYSPDAKAEREPLDKAYSDAMAEVHAAYPDDLDITTFYAESIMDLSPWDYWERDFTTPKPHIVKALGAVESVLAANENHPGAIHLYIHLTEPSRTPERAAPYADRLAAQLPAAGHLVHMPGHTYFRIGRYLDALETNVHAVAADESYLDSVDGSDLYRYGYYPHNVHFVLVSAQMAGDQAIALEFAEKLDALIPVEMATTAPWIQPIKAAPLFAYVQYADAEKIASLPAPPEELPYLKSIWHYVQGVSAAREGDLAAAGTHSAAIAALGAHPSIAKMDSQDVPASDVLRLADLMVQARMAQASGDNERAKELLIKAAELQNTIPYTEPPYWYYPVQQTLGAVLLSSGEANAAAQAFRDSLMIHPNNAWSLYGLMKAQEGAEDPAAAITKDLYERASALKGEVPLDRL